MLIKRLQTNALSEKEIMTPGQIKSAEILLRKAVPDLQSVQLQGDADRPLTVEIIKRTYGNDPTSG
mgnify:FL=1